MAKKKKKKSTTSRKSGKRVRGASATDALLMVVGGILGGIGTTFANQKVTFLQNKWVALAETAIGGVLVWKVAHPFIRGMGVGVSVAGSASAAKGFGLLAGVGAYRNFNRATPINGFRQVPKIGNPAIPGRQFPQPNAVGRTSANMYAGVYGGN
jgi:hypothetical protein